MSRERKPTSTSSFGVGRREGHDTSQFYEQFPTPSIGGNRCARSWAMYPALSARVRCRWEAAEGTAACCPPVGYER